MTGVFYLRDINSLLWNGKFAECWINATWNFIKFVKEILYNHFFYIIAILTLKFQPLGASDYLQMSRFFHTVILRDIPILNQLSKGAAKRFITLIDTLYDNKVSFSFLNSMEWELFRLKKRSKYLLFVYRLICAFYRL